MSTPVALAHLMACDGKTRLYGIILCTHSFTIQDNVRLINDPFGVVLIVPFTMVEVNLLFTLKPILYLNYGLSFFLTSILPLVISYLIYLLALLVLNLVFYASPIFISAH